MVPFTLVKAKLSRLQETTSKECVGEHATTPLTGYWRLTLGAAPNKAYYL